MARKKNVELEEDTELDLDSEVHAKNILICNSNQTFGIAFKRGYVELYERTLFSEDTTLGVGDKVAHYKAGQYGPWKLSSRPYPAKWEHALGYICEWVAQDNLAEVEDLNYIIEVLNETKQDIINSVKSSIDAYLAQTR